MILNSGFDKAKMAEWFNNWNTISSEARDIRV